MPNEYRDHSAVFLGRFERELGRRLDAAAVLVLNHVRQLISVEGTTKIGRGKRAKLIYGTHPSSPGEPPRVQTGRLRASMAWERDGKVARVGTNIRYGRYLEEGTGRMAARPFLLRALREKTDAVRAILSKPIGF